MNLYYVYVTAGTFLQTANLMKQYWSKMSKDISRWQWVWMLWPLLFRGENKLNRIAVNGAIFTYTHRMMNAFKCSSLCHFLDWRNMYLKTGITNRLKFVTFFVCWFQKLGLEVLQSESLLFTLWWHSWERNLPTHELNSHSCLDLTKPWPYILQSFHLLILCHFGRHKVLFAKRCVANPFGQCVILKVSELRN